MTHKKTAKQNVKDSDIIILVLGLTGAGKSTFINAAAGTAVTIVEHGLDSCAGTVECVPVTHPRNASRRVIFVDTPGFNDTGDNDAHILELIVGWLARLNKEGMKLSGVIYLHDISQPRIEPARENLAMLGRLCRDDVVKNVVLATTKWRNILGDEGMRREQQLSKTYWKKMLDEGANTARFMDTLESAWGIVDLIPKNQPVDALLIQEELETFRGRLLKFQAQTGSAGGILSLLRSLLGLRR